MSISEQLTNLALNLISTLGYGGLSIGLIVDSAGIPIPSEVLIPLAGALARQGRFSMTAVIIVGTLAQTAGAVLGYWIGREGGLPLVQKYGKYVLFNERELHTTERWFSKYGSWLTLAGRCMPVIRTYIAFPAGVAKMPFARYLTFSLVGSAGWTVLLAVLGYQLAGHLEVIHETLHRFSLLVVGLLVLGIIWYVSHHLRKKA